MKPQNPSGDVDLRWLERDSSDVRLMFEPPKPPPPKPAPPPEPVVASAPEPPPPPPGPSPEELRLKAECEQMLITTSAALGELQEAVRLELGKTAELITEMGLCVAEELAAGAIDVDENRVVALITEALELLNSEREVKVHLNPALYERLAEGGHLEMLRKEHHVTLRPEARVADRGCIVESPTGQVDARVRSRLRQLRHLLSEKQGIREG